MSSSSPPEPHIDAAELDAADQIEDSQAAERALIGLHRYPRPTAVSGHAALMDGDPVIQRSVHLRNPYVDPLNYLQIGMLRRLRALPDPEGPAADGYREVIVLTVNGIAAGLRNTG